MSIKRERGVRRLQIFRSVSHFDFAILRIITKVLLSDEI